MHLVRPAFVHLSGYVDALQRGWSADNVLGEVTRRRELRAIAADAAAFLESLDDPQARGAPITRPDGTQVPRLPGFRRWLWDGAFCGSIGFRWQPGTSVLPAWVPGHIGYSVVPWKRRQGHATRALQQLLAEIAPLGLQWVDLTTDPDNVPSQRVILNCGGECIGQRKKDVSFGAGEEVLWRIDLSRQSMS